MDIVPLLAALLVILSACFADRSQIEATGSVPLSGRATVDLCSAAIRERAAQYDPLSIEASLTKPVHESSDGRQIATIYVEIRYRREGGIEPRAATITCTVSPDGDVMALQG
jgi:hypothetical protein